MRWSVPDGFTVAPEPSILDVSLVDSAVYMRWETYGWQMGKITGMVTSGTPRLIKKFNYRIVWADGSKGPAKLQVDNYGHGSHARYNSWVILTPATGENEPTLDVRLESVCPLFRPPSRRRLCHAASPWL